jgi:hypothetical protein
MTSAQVQRTLVKSPPELWAELSDPASLARHLGELGEIRITRVEPEHKVEWTAEHASGSVLIKPSAWGTRVTLTASREQGGDPASARASGRPGEPAGAQATPGPEVAPGPPPGPALPALEASPPPPSPSAQPLTGAGTLIVPAEPAIATQRAPAAPAERAAAADPDPATAASDQAPVAAEHAAAATATRDAVPAPTRDRPAARREPVGTSTQAPAAPEPVAPEGPPVREATAPEPAGESRRGFFPRLLHRFRRAEPVGGSTRANDPPQQAPLAAPEPLSTTARERGADHASESPAERPRLAVPAPEPTPEAATAQPVDGPPSAQPLPSQRDGAAAPGASADAPADEVTAVLNSVLDRLGAAHHRPFSRA